MMGWRARVAKLVDAAGLKPVAHPEGSVRVRVPPRAPRPVIKTPAGNTCSVPCAGALAGCSRSGRALRVRSEAHHPTHRAA
jgi:hypothetical protein